MASRQLYPKVLFFINGMAPTDEQVTQANEYGPGVVFRNAAMVGDEPIEDADAVAGDVPQRYKDALPGVDDRDAISKRMELRNPNNATMFQGDRNPPRYDELTDEQRDAKNANDVSRGAKPLPVNERHSEPRHVEHRLTQAGTPRSETSPGNDGWTGDGKKAFEFDPVSGRPVAPKFRTEPGQPSHAQEDGWSAGGDINKPSEVQTGGDPNRNDDGSVKLESNVPVGGDDPAKTAAANAAKNSNKGK